MKPSLDQKLGTTMLGATGIKRQASTKPNTPTRVKKTKRIKNEDPIELPDNDIKMDIDVSEEKSTSVTKRETRGKHVDLTAAFETDSDDAHRRMYHSTSDEYDPNKAADGDDELEEDAGNSSEDASRLKKAAMAKTAVTSLAKSKKSSIMKPSPMKRELRADTPLPTIESRELKTMLTPPASHCKIDHTSRISPADNEDFRTYKTGMKIGVQKQCRGMSDRTGVGIASKTVSPAKSLEVIDLDDYEKSENAVSGPNKSAAIPTPGERSTTLDGTGSVSTQEKEKEFSTGKVKALMILRRSVRLTIDQAREVVILALSRSGFPPSCLEFGARTLDHKQLLYFRDENTNCF